MLFATEALQETQQERNETILDDIIEEDED